MVSPLNILQPKFLYIFLVFLNLVTIPTLFIQFGYFLLNLAIYVYVKIFSVINVSP